MNMEQAYNDQMDVTKQMVSELKKANESLLLINDKLNVLTKGGFETPVNEPKDIQAMTEQEFVQMIMQEVLGDILGINGAALGDLLPLPNLMPGEILPYDNDNEYGSGDCDCNFCKVVRNEDDNVEDDDWGIDLDEVRYDELLAICEVAEEDADELLSKEQLPYLVYGKTYHLYEPYSTQYVHIVASEERGTVKAILFDANGVEVKRGVAKCHPEDIFFEEIGTAIAVRRLFELEIPELYIQKSDL